MRISNEQAQQILGAQKAKGPKGPQEVAEAGAVRGADAVSMSSAGQEIGKALQALASVPDMRADRVAELRAQIEAGTYHVGGREIAESLVRRAADRLL